MNLTVTVFFDAKLGYYRVRFRGPRYDKKERVPARVYELRGIDPTKPSRQAETIAQEWAVGRKRELEGHRGAATNAPMELEAIFNLYKRRNPNGSAPITLSKTEQSFRNLIAFDPIRHASPGTIDSGIALDYFDHRIKDGASPRTVANEIRVLIHLLGLAYEWQRETGVDSVRLTKFPKRIGDAVKMRAHKGRTLTMRQFFDVLEQRTLRLSITKRFRRIVIVGATTGLRRDNLLALRWSWIDRKRGWLTIPAAAMKGRVTEKRTLSVPLSEWALEAIGERRGASDYVFASGAGGRTWRVDKTLQSVAAKAKVGAFTLHDLRRTFATWLKGEGVDVRIIGALLGHSSRTNAAGALLVDTGNVTEAKYLFVSPSEMQAAIRALDEALDRTFRENFGKTEDVPSRTNSRVSRWIAA